ncbi:MAG: phosphoribosylamine--glycine ligase [Pseudomonadota bacterium]
MNILILGSGGREHALAWAIAQNPKCERLIAAPGNAGIARVAHCAPLDIMDPAAVVAFARAESIDFVVVGPEAPLAAGVADALRAQDILVFGPSAAAAQLEASKAFTKSICDACGAPTAAYAHFSAAGPAKAYIEEQGVPIVVKADGLAAGKGVTVATELQTAIDAVDTVFADAGAEVVIEAVLAGEEASFFVLCDGTETLPIGTAQDHKRVFDGDTGPNTGGMGAYSPAPVMTPQVTEDALERIVRPTLAEMAARGMPYQGVLYVGLMIDNGAPSLVEYNVRFGDPECQVLMMRLGAQILDAMLDCVEGRLESTRLNWAGDHALTVVLAAAGYPGTYAKGTEIRGLDHSANDPLVQIFHAGTRTEGDSLRANGGRVLNVTARGATLTQARDRAYAAVAQVDWDDAQYRRDIGWRALQSGE